MASRLLALIMSLGLVACSGGDPGVVDGDDDDGGAGDSIDDERGPWTPSPGVSLVPFASCDEADAEIKASAIEELDAILRGVQAGDAAVLQEVHSLPWEAAPAIRARQEPGVVEADPVQTDGAAIYVASGQHLLAVDITEPGQLGPAVELAIEGRPSRVLLDAELSRAVVLSSVLVSELPDDHPVRELLSLSGGDSLTKVSVLDVTDPIAPVLEREIWLESAIESARLVDHAVRIVASAQIDMPGLGSSLAGALPYPDEQDVAVDGEAVRAESSSLIAAAVVPDLLPRAYERLAGGELRVIAPGDDDCGSLRRATDSAGRQITSLVSFDLAASGDPAASDWLLSDQVSVYETADRIYLAGVAWPWWWGWSRVRVGERFTPATNVHAFDVAGARPATYAASGRLAGELVEDFALDEEAGHLRAIALRVTTEAVEGDPWFDRRGFDSTSLHVLEERAGELASVGRLDDIATTRVEAVHLAPDVAYLVARTPESGADLIAVDLADPGDPTARTALHLPFAASALTPLDGAHLLAVGRPTDGNEAGDLLVSLLDVSGPGPVRLLGTDGPMPNTYSDAESDPRTLAYSTQDALLVVHRRGEIYDGEGGRAAFNQLGVLALDPAVGLEQRGAVDLVPFEGPDPFEGGFGHLRRSFFQGAFLYVVSDLAVTANRVDDLSQVSVTELTPTDL